MNENTGRPYGPEYSSRPDAHGHAALLLVESLIHGLIERSILTMGDAVEIADVAVEVNTEIIFDGERESAAMAKSLQLLRGISASLKIDLRGRSP